MNNTSPPPMPDEPCVSAGQPEAYETPGIVYESVLEVRAGSTIGVLPDLLDLTGTNK